MSTPPRTSRTLRMRDIHVIYADSNSADFAGFKNRLLFHRLQLSRICRICPGSGAAPIKAIARTCKFVSRSTVVALLQLLSSCKTAQSSCKIHNRTHAYNIHVYTYSDAHSITPAHITLRI